jgi:hypothetical protein
MGVSEPDRSPRTKRTGLMLWNLGWYKNDNSQFLILSWTVKCRYPSVTLKHNSDNHLDLHWQHSTHKTVNTNKVGKKMVASFLSTDIDVVPITLETQLVLLHSSGQQVCWPKLLKTFKHRTLLLSHDRFLSLSLSLTHTHTHTHARTHTHAQRERERFSRSSVFVHCVHMHRNQEKYHKMSSASASGFGWRAWNLE